MLEFNSKQTDSIGDDFGFTDKQMTEFGQKMEDFFVAFTKVMKEEDKRGTPAQEIAKKFFKAFSDEFNTQELQDLLLIQCMGNAFADALENLYDEKIRRLIDEN